MVEKGSRIILRTQNAIYSTCEVVSVTRVSDVIKTLTVKFCAGTKRDRATGDYHMVTPVETILAKDIIFMSERT